jgi:exodeoxyribonuclease VII large subunit
MILFDDTQPLTLSTLNGIVREAIEDAMPDSYWVQAELASVRENRGHCYMELIEKVNDGAIVAQARACCWKNTWMTVGRNFCEVTGSPLSSGMKVLMRVHASFHEAFGFSWIVDEIDPTFTLGDMARRRQEIIRILTEEGVIDLNKQLSISPFCQRIAVISSATAAGYGDFCNQLADNPYGFQFHTQLFPAIMQGEQVESSIIQALNKIHSSTLESGTSAPFDCVVIIRGGGSTTDLSGFDTLALAENVANFPLPVITGIGHERDKSILDIVACVSVNTPTAVAEFLIANLAHTAELIDGCTQRMTIAVQQRLETEKLRLQQMEQSARNVFSIRKLTEENRLKNYFLKLSNLSERQVIIERNKIELLEHRTTLLDPINILKRGYSMTLHNGKVVRDAQCLNGGDDITVMFEKGSVNATVKNP